MTGTASKYLRFMAMIAISMVVMYLLTYFHTYVWGHVRWSETRFFMALIMGGGMIFVMLSFMLGMYRNLPINIGIYAAGAILLAAGTYLVRSQVTVDDQDYMKGMIPHHSIAILTSERAQTKDVRVRRLADAIIEAQRREIKEMDWLIEDIQKNGLATTEAMASQRPVPKFEASP